MTSFSKIKPLAFNTSVEFLTKLVRFINAFTVRKQSNKLNKLPSVMLELAKEDLGKRQFPKNTLVIEAAICHYASLFCCINLPKQCKVEFPTHCHLKVKASRGLSAAKAIIVLRAG